MDANGYDLSTTKDVVRVQRLITRTITLMRSEQLPVEVVEEFILFVCDPRIVPFARCNIPEMNEDPAVLNGSVKRLVDAANREPLPDNGLNTAVTFGDKMLSEMMLRRMLAAMFSMRTSQMATPREATLVSKIEKAFSEFNTGSEASPVVQQIDQAKLSSAKSARARWNNWEGPEHAINAFITWCAAGFKVQNTPSMGLLCGLYALALSLSSCLGISLAKTTDELNEILYSARYKAILQDWHRANDPRMHYNLEDLQNLSYDHLALMLKLWSESRDSTIRLGVAIKAKRAVILGTDESDSVIFVSNSGGEITTEQGAILLYAHWEGFSKEIPDWSFISKAAPGSDAASMTNVAAKSPIKFSAESIPDSAAESESESAPESTENVVLVQDDPTQQDTEHKGATVEKWQAEMARNPDVSSIAARELLSEVFLGNTVPYQDDDKRLVAHYIDYLKSVRAHGDAEILGVLSEFETNGYIERDQANLLMAYFQIWIDVIHEQRVNALAIEPHDHSQQLDPTEVGAPYTSPTSEKRKKMTSSSNSSQASSARPLRKKVLLDSLVRSMAEKKSVSKSPEARSVRSLTHVSETQLPFRPSPKKGGSIGTNSSDQASEISSSEWVHDRQPPDFEELPHEQTFSSPSKSSSEKSMKES